MHLVDELKTEVIYGLRSFKTTIFKYHISSFNLCYNVHDKLSITLLAVANTLP
jgi:mRNA-degrading endonuclease RelE of RelBE toxin-antitoxin system